ncbi:MAG TPA: M28 family peptidase [Pyrinomonadaceae bacterium]|nr:M28 family peptidase [Pyrinomonadaceae bacterium]
MRRLIGVGLALTSLFLAQPPVAPSARQARGVNATAAAAAASATFAAERSAAERITAEGMKEILYYIASDEMAGRNTPSPGLNKTAEYIADRLKKLKVKPAGDDGSYFQRIALAKTEVDRENSGAQLGERSFKLGQDFLAYGRVSGEAEGQVVYAGHGWVVRPKNIDPYQGLDVRDKIVVVSGDGVAPPAGLSLAGLRGGDWESPISYAQKNGARALVLVPRNFERRWRYGAFAASRPSFTVPRLENMASDDDAEEQPEQTAQSIVSIIPSRAMLEALFAGEALDGAAVLNASTAQGSAPPSKGFALNASKRLRIALKLSVTEEHTQNVVGVLEGKDSTLKQEYVALGAHYDHVGESAATGCRPVGNDTICNGADDDGSGTTALLAMAEAFSKGPRPKRSILFVWHAGEEKGLWGSEYFTRYPTVPLKQVVAQLNIDMIGRSKQAGDTNPANKMLTGPDEIYVIGSRMMSTQLAELNERVNRDYLNLKYNYHYDEPNDPERLFYRSDHFNYAKHGVPIIFYFDGVHEDYHRPGDSPDKIDYQKMQKIARTVFILASELANAPARPVVDKQIPAGMQR